MAMAFLLRRALLAKCIPFFRHPRYISNHSQLTHALTCELDTVAPLVSSKGGIVCTGFVPLWANRRGFAKGRKSSNTSCHSPSRNINKIYYCNYNLGPPYTNICLGLKLFKWLLPVRVEDESSSTIIQDVPDIGTTVKSHTLSLMEAAIAALSRELSKIRTGRASTGMLDHIIVDARGVKLPLNRVAVVSAVDAHTLSVTPYDPNTLKEIENALVSSPLGINPILGDQRIITPIPPLTKENIQALCKLVSKCAEDGRQSIRRSRQKALDTIKKSASSIPKDDLKRLEKEIEEITKRFIKSADEMSRAKEQEIAGR